jgi:hypothetical protein
VNGADDDVLSITKYHSTGLITKKVIGPMTECLAAESVRLRGDDAPTYTETKELLANGC